MAQNTILAQAQTAIKAGEKQRAAVLLKNGLRQNPRDYRLWLLLAQVAPNFAARQQCVERAAALAPDSPYVQKAQQWLESQQPAPAAPPRPQPKPTAPERPRPQAAVSKQTASLPTNDDLLARLRQRSQAQVTEEEALVKVTEPRRLGRRWLWGGMAALLLVMVVLTGFVMQTRDWGAAVITADEAETTAIAAVPTVLTEEPAAVSEDQPAADATATPAAANNAPATFTPTPIHNPIQAKEVAAKNNSEIEPRATWTLTPTPTNTPTPSPTVMPTRLFEGGELSMPLVGPNEKWVDVNLTTQYLRAYEGQDVVFETYISSGLPQYATVTGQFRIYYRLESQTMDGRRLGFDYVTENVPYVQYFYGDFALHGAWWHNNFGQQMSHGCVNLSVPDSKWLYEWADYGTLVNVHY